MGLHDDPRLGSVNPCLPRALGAYHLAVFVLLGVLPEVPDVAFVVLGEPVVGLLDELAAFPSPVIDHHALHTHYLFSVVGDAHLVALSAALVDEGGTRLQREILIVDSGGELVGIDVWSVSLLLLRGSLLLRGGAGAPRREHEHRSHQGAQKCFSSHQLRPSFPEGRCRAVCPVHIEGCGLRTKYLQVNNESPRLPADADRAIRPASTQPPSRRIGAASKSP